MNSGSSETTAHAWTVRLPGLSEVGNDRVVPARAMGLKACGALGAVIIILHHRVSLEAISLALLNPAIAGAVFSEVRLGCACCAVCSRQIQARWWGPCLCKAQGVFS